ncbi:MAG: carboxylating nicotinate-nucleotide diphosphorylase [Gammaproteobacteria bacterium]
MSQAESLARAIARNVRDALAEDIGPEDHTGNLVPESKMAIARVVAKQAAVICGAPWFDACIRALDPRATIEWHIAEGGRAFSGDLVCTVAGKARAILAGERPALNFLQTLSGTAAAAATYVAAIEGASPNPNGCRILDTRKTLPGMRQAQKYAVRSGGGANHRMGLWDGILVKENHIAACGGIKEALFAARNSAKGLPVQIEVENLDQLQEALRHGATSVLLDDFSLEDMHRGFKLTDGRAQLEVSGGVSLKTVRAIAATGVDRISIGGLTKNVDAADLSMRIE